MKKRFTEEDLLSMFNILNEQMTDDRKVINDAYDELRNYIKEHPTRWIDSGEILVRLGDLKLKQTGHVVDVFKALEKVIPKEDFDELSDIERLHIDSQIRKENE